jgi:hypothetical protein
VLKRARQATGPDKAYFFVYFATEEEARAAAAVFEGRGYLTDVDESASEDGSWLLVARRKPGAGGTEADAESFGAAAG